MLSLHDVSFRRSYGFFGWTEGQGSGDDSVAQGGSYSRPAQRCLGDGGREAECSAEGRALITATTPIC